MNPAETASRFAPRNPGIWLYHCQVNDSGKAGLAARHGIGPSRPIFPLHFPGKPV